MDPISHVASFYLIGRGVKANRLWVGMIAALLPDLPLVFMFLSGFIAGQGGGVDSTWPLNLFMHSFLALIILIPIAIISFRHFYVAIAGYSYHLILDYFTHTTIRMPLYPLSEWKAPTYIVSYLDLPFLLIMNGIIFALVAVFERKRVVQVFRSLIRNPLWKRSRPILSIYIVLAYALVAAYVSSIATADSVSSALLWFLMGTNLMLIGFLFWYELRRDDSMQEKYRRITDFLFREAIHDEKP